MFRLAARIGLVELALSGCATVADHNYHYVPGMPYDGSAILFDEADKLGLRFVLCRGGGTLSRLGGDTSHPALRPEPLDAFLSHIEQLAARYHDSAPDAPPMHVWLSVACTKSPGSMNCSRATWWQMHCGRTHHAGPFDAPT